MRRSWRAWLVGVAFVVSGCAAGPGSPSAPATAPGQPTPTGEPSPSAAPEPSGLPAGLEDRTWFTEIGYDGEGRPRYVAGTLAGQARIELPAGSVPLAAHAGRVAAVENAGAGRQARSTVSISAIGGSATTVSVTLDAFVNFGIFVGSELIVTGESADDRMAPAVVAIDVETGARRTILPEAPVPEGWNGITPARTLAASASGRTLVAGLCSYGRETCQATIVELPGGTVRGSFALPGFLRPGGFGGATDDLLIFGVGETKIGAAELRSGEVLWRQTADGFYGGYLTADGGLVVERSRRGDLEIVRFDVATGSDRVLLSIPPGRPLALWPELSTDRVAVLGAGGGLAHAGATAAAATLATLDLATGVLSENVFELVLHAAAGE